jgi:hypothetical protein
VFVDVFCDKVVRFDELPYLHLKRVLLGLLLIKRDPTTMQNHSASSLESAKTNMFPSLVETVQPFSTWSIL